MRILKGEEEQKAMMYLRKAAKIAQDSPCFRSRCGSVIVSKNSSRSTGKIIGAGYNSPAGEEVLDHCRKDDLPKHFKSDKTCCVHAEQRAISDALKMNYKKLPGARLYFIRIDDKGKMLRAGDPYCTICSKASLDERLAEFVLLRNEGVCVYDTKEYNDISFAYRGE